jgi:AraC-like DNA-binding protein
VNDWPPEIADTHGAPPHHSTAEPVTPSPISDVLETLPLRCWLPGRFALTAPWGVHVATELGWFYVVLSGQARVEAPRHGPAITATAGDLVIVAQGAEHCLRDSGTSPLTPIQSLLTPQHFTQREPLRHGGQGTETRLVCGCSFLDGLQRSPLHAALPAVLRVPGIRQRPAPFVVHIVRLLEMETSGSGTDGQDIAGRLVRVLYLKALQNCCTQLPVNATNWLRALVDPDIGRALSLMHAQPDAPWTVAALAERVAMSRSTFAARFLEVVGQPPLEYLTQWRIHKACRLLRTTRAELKEVAAQVGYESTSAFSKAFAHWVGAAPGAYRRAGARNTRSETLDATPW